jgi:pilus assembly protein CpaB
MGSARIITLVVAAVAAIALMLIVGRLISHKPASGPAPVAAPAVQTANVVVAAHDLPIGERLVSADLTTQAWPLSAVNAAYITDGQPAPAPRPGAAGVADKTSRAATAAVNAVTGGRGPMDGLIGAIVKTPILANEPITNAKLVRGGEGGYMSVVLRKGMRAIAVPVSVNTAAGGFILPGDHVDVIQAHQGESNNGGTRPFVVQTVLENVRVLAIDQTAQPPKNGGQSDVGAVATLEVDPAGAEHLALAKAQGEMILTLRSFADALGPSRGGPDNGALGTVRIIRNGQISEATVTP